MTDFSPTFDLSIFEAALADSSLFARLVLRRSAWANGCVFRVDYQGRGEPDQPTERVVLSVYRSSDGRVVRRAGIVETEFAVIYNADEGDGVAEPVHSIEQLAEIVRRHHRAPSVGEGASESEISCPFNRAQVRLFVRTVKAEWGRGWDMLGETIQRALIAEHCLSVLTAQDDDRGWLPAEIQATMNAMEQEAGLE